METQYSYACSNKLDNTGCNFSISKTFSSASITHDELKKLIPIGKRIHKKNLISSKGKSWESDIWIKSDPDKGYVVTFKD